LVELDLDRGLLDAIDITIGHVQFLQADDFWKEPLCCQVCWQMRHVKSSCSSSMVQTQSSDPSTTVYASTKASEKGLIDNGSFLGKMHLLFPSFFNKLSSTEINYLKCNENWVLDLFGDLWGLLMKSIETTVDYRALWPLGCDLVSPEGLHNPPPPSEEPTNVVPLSVLEHDVILTRGTCPFKDVSASGDPNLKYSS